MREAASGTKGGSSGSPVVDWQGRAVALNPGNKSSSASTFFLPLERVVRALRFIQKSKDSSGSGWEDVTIPRGTLQVQDLHSITPNFFLEVSGAVIQSLSYQQSRNFRFKCGLVYVAEPGYMLSRSAVPHHAIIKKFAGKEIP
ncbi:protease Do-like 7 [Papaver somniferum]|uniref:protease Do-like 7 n=1 Tax=Papaver somniferum TaxID=3469 RepID=UPI000E6FB50A|nr:protease Do-like 7 [Papaver somniferum]XP_026445132.1 protease Do-like 7 [Papaver somniferum]XP_026445133.1 protease Do-like 7 [Papaver somniferum]XP_026445134.1 protease Do-like 7 [Papaver somniferum]XP_026445135.1 protease Do-like 7 [Papaver somniferum]XP_026445136.1 protease Do-like 7 [Papaver somniferum]